MSDDQSQMARITLRLPVELHERLIKAAAQDNRSMNAEIIYIIESYFESINRNKKTSSTELSESSQSSSKKDESAASLTKLLTENSANSETIEKAIEEASERGAIAAYERLLRLLAETNEDNLENRDYGELTIRLLKGLSNEPDGYNRSKTPSIPGVNAPKRGLSSSSKTKK